MASDNSLVASYGMTLRLMRGAMTLVPQPLLSATSAYVGFIGGAADLVAHPFRRVTATVITLVEYPVCIVKLMVATHGCVDLEIFIWALYLQI